MKMIKFLILLVIILFAAPAPAAVYKFVDEQGNVRFTDDINQVPEDQRDPYDTSSEYEIYTEAEPEYTETESTQVAESEDFNDDDLETDPELVSSYDDEPEMIEGFDDDSDNSADVGVPENQKEDGVSLDQADNNQEELNTNLNNLQTLKKEIDKEYAALVEEKEKLAEEQKALTTREEILKFNIKVNNLNKRAEAYVQKGRQYKEQVEAYNELVILRNAKLAQ